MEWGIFNGESANYTAEEAVEAQFYSRESAEDALADRYDDGDCHVHECEEPEDDEEEEGEDDGDGE